MDEGSGVVRGAIDVDVGIGYLARTLHVTWWHPCDVVLPSSERVQRVRMERGPVEVNLLLRAITGVLGVSLLCGKRQCIVRDPMDRGGNRRGTANSQAIEVIDPDRPRGRA